MSLPRGVTYWTIARQFRDGASVYDLARKYLCYSHDIEAAIRAVMQRARVRI